MMKLLLLLILCAIFLTADQIVIEKVRFKLESKTSQIYFIQIKISRKCIKHFNNKLLNIFSFV